jgi:DNA-binding MarR family transcriptional regulator
MNARRPPGESPAARRRELLSGQSVTFLASQVGAHSSRLWSERLSTAGLDTRGVMLLWNIGSAEGRSQRQLAEALRLPPSRIVDLVDALERQGWLERQTSASDRRANELYLTDQGRLLLEQVMVIAARHEDEFTSGLQPRERAALRRLLGKVAANQGLLDRAHPNFYQGAAWH